MIKTVIILASWEVEFAGEYNLVILSSKSEPKWVNVNCFEHRLTGTLRANYEAIQ